MMKNLFLNILMIVVLLVSCSSPTVSYSPEQSKIIGTPIKIENLEVAQFDFPNTSIWKNAIKACSDLGNGWRLPTRVELLLLYKNKDKIGGFKGYGLYWSSTEVDNGSAWRQLFASGNQNANDKNYYGYVRAVRSF